MPSCSGCRSIERSRAIEPDGERIMRQCNPTIVVVKKADKP